MRFHSTAGKSPPAGFREAVQRGLAPDGGLYMPETVPRLPESTLGRMKDMPLAEIGFHAASPFVGQDIPPPRLREVVERAIDFEAPLIPLSGGGLHEGLGPIYSQELFHGPSLAFKDFGARFMARALSLWASRDDKRLTILVATSGDTGSAVAMGFYEVPGIEVVILYPSGKVSRLQEQQLTALGGNVRALEVQGAFDDCQRLVKQAFQDEGLRRRKRLSSANSINLARLIPQTFYYVFAASRLAQEGRPLVVSVPSGNFGNLTAGLFAKRMGAPIERFVASTNVNDVVPEYLETGCYRPRPSVRTLSNAMDVGDPSNFDRVLALYRGDGEAIRGDIAGRRCDDQETLDAIRRVHAATGYLLDPHGAVGYRGLVSYLRERSDGAVGVFLETAHPAKFREVCEKATGQPVEMPQRLEKFLKRPKKAEMLPADYEAFRELLLAD